MLFGPAIPGVVRVTTARSSDGQDIAKVPPRYVRSPVTFRLSPASVRSLNSSGTLLDRINAFRGNQHRNRQSPRVKRRSPRRDWGENSAYFHPGTGFRPQITSSSAGRYNLQRFATEKAHF